MDDLEKKKRHIAACERWRKANMDKVRAAAKARYWKNHEKKLAEIRKWRVENREKSRIAARRWQENNKEKFKSDHAAWRQRNSDKRSAEQSKRKAIKLKANPAWSNDFFIREAYNLAALRTKITGFKWHVDHIVPLKSSFVCGLHAHTNIRVIPAVQNISKHNRHWPDMP